MSNSNIEMKVMPTNYNALLTSSYCNYLGREDNSLIEENPEIGMNCSLSKILPNPLLEGYHFLCKECKKILKIMLIKRDGIKILCGCPNSPRDISIIKMKEYLVNSEEEVLGIFKCPKHIDIGKDNKYKFYCTQCKNKKLCLYCNECNDHINKVKSIPTIFEIKTIKKLNYIFEKYENNKKSFDNNILSDEKDNIRIEININNNSNDRNENVYNDDEENLRLNENNNIINTASNNKNNNFNNRNDINNDFLDEKTEIISLLNNKSDSILENSFHDLIYIIRKDYEDYPNSDYMENINIIENFINYICNKSTDKLNEMLIKYEINENMVSNAKVELFGQNFVDNNKEKCFVIINEKVINLKRYYYLSDILENNKSLINWPIVSEIKIIVKPDEKLTNLSFMFYGISALNSTDFSNFSNININSMSYMFYNCSTLKSLLNISKINTNDVKNMSYLFYNCNSLAKLPDISKWKTFNVTNMSYMFFNCNSLTELPDISDWETNKVIDMSYLFSKCSLLSKIPDISKWETSNLENMKNMFSGCLLLTSFPKIFNWDIKAVTNMNSLFLNCKLLRYEHSISEWLVKVSKLNLYNKNIFEGCDSIIIPNNNLISLQQINNYCRCIFKGFCIYSNIFFIIVWFIIISLFFTPPFFLIYYSFNLEEKKNFIINPLKYNNFTELINYTDFSDFKNQTNYTSNEEIIEFNSNQKKLITINIILAIITILFLIITFLKIKINFPKEKYYYVTIVIFAFLAFISDIIDYKIYNTLYNIVICIIEKLENGLNVEFDDKYQNVFNEFKSEYIFNYYNFFAHSLFTAFIVFKYNAENNYRNDYSCRKIYDKTIYENLKNSE